MSANKTFNLLWLGQLISNLGTQMSFYGVGIWLFSKSGDIKDFALVALVVQIARLSSLPFIANSIRNFPRKKLMLLSNIFGAFCTINLAIILFKNSFNFNIYLLLLIQGLAAAADAIMIISFSSFKIEAPNFCALIKLGPSQPVRNNAIYDIQISPLEYES